MARQQVFPDGHILICACERRWQVRRHAPDFQRRGRVHCRCRAVLGEDDNGSWNAILIAPRERFVVPRKALAQLGVFLLRLGRVLRIPIWRWLKASSLSTLQKPNTAVHVRVKTEWIPEKEPFRPRHH